MDRSLSSSRRLFLVFGFGIAGAMSIAPAQAQELCGGVDYPFPYTDVSAVGAAFCPGIMEAYVTGVSKGTTPTTFSPNETVTRVQMTTFLQRSLDLTRASRRTVLKQLWQNNFGQFGPQTIMLGDHPVFCAADGENIWVAAEGEMDQVLASTGKILDTWTVFTQAWPIAAIPGSLITADHVAPYIVYQIRPDVSPMVFLVATLPGSASSVAYDGVRIWVASDSGTVSTLQGSILSTYSAGFNKPVGLVYDGAQMWVTDHGAGTLLPVAPDGTIGTPVTVGAGPEQPAFDGENIWVPNSSDNSITVVQASTGKVVATIASDGTNMLSGPEQASFDGERMLVTNSLGDSVTIFKAADLSFIANIPTGAGSTPYGACSDGIDFWVALRGTHNLLRF